MIHLYVLSSLRGYISVYFSHTPTASSLSVFCWSLEHTHKLYVSLVGDTAGRPWMARRVFYWPACRQAFISSLFWSVDNALGQLPLAGSQCALGFDAPFPGLGVGPDLRGPTSLLLTGTRGEGMQFFFFSCRSTIPRLSFHRGADITIIFSHGNAEDIGMVIEYFKEVSTLWSCNFFVYEYVGKNVCSSSCIRPRPYPVD